MPRHHTRTAAPAVPIRPEQSNPVRPDLKLFPIRRGHHNALDWSDVTAEAVPPRSMEGREAERVRGERRQQQRQWGASACVDRLRVHAPQRTPAPHATEDPIAPCFGSRFHPRRIAPRRTIIGMDPAGAGSSFDCVLALLAARRGDGATARRRRAGAWLGRSNRVGAGGDQRACSTLMIRALNSPGLRRTAGPRSLSAVRACC